MYRPFSAISCINNNVQLVEDKMYDPMFILEEVEVTDVDKYGDAECGMFVVDDAEAAELVLSRLVGMPEPELYSDEKSPLSYQVDKDKLAQVVELQLRMNYGMEMIQEQTVARDVLRIEYYGLKDRIANGWNIINKEQDYGKKLHLRTFMAKITKEKNDIGATLGDTNEYLSSLWDHWNKLRDECKAIIGKDKTIWVAYFEIEDKQSWYDDYINSDNWFDSVEFDTVEEVSLPIMAQNDRLALSREKWHVTSAKRLANI